MQGQHRYSIYVDHKVENWLIISGVGEIKASTATEYLSEVSDVKSWTVWVNIGIAGSSVGNYGDLFLIDKIIQDSSKKCFYLGAVVKTKIQKSVLVTVDKPLLNYSKFALVDMEAAAFAMVALKKSCRELVLVMKVVSDGPNHPINDITARSASELILLNLNDIFEYVEKLTILAQTEKDRFDVPSVYFDILKRWHFSVSQLHELKKLILRWEVATPSTNVMHKIQNFSSSREVILYLKDTLTNYEIDWTQV
ncbi:hypothetical protein N9P21_02660 [Rhodobacteraceae bacterium]|nr:hypothetical protein [Paracoccaceae bacterium]